MRLWGSDLCSLSDVRCHLRLVTSNGNTIEDNRCFLFALQTSGSEAIVDAYLVVARDRDGAEKVLQHVCDVTNLGQPRCLGEWAGDQIATRCWVEATKRSITLAGESAHSLAEITWD